MTRTISLTLGMLLTLSGAGVFSGCSEFAQEDDMPEAQLASDRSPPAAADRPGPADDQPGMPEAFGVGTGSMIGGDSGEQHR